MICEQHNIAMGCPRLDDIGPSPYVVSGEVEVKHLVAVYAVTLEKNIIACSITLAKGMRRCRDTSG